jgi:hypothetical protein
VALLSCSPIGFLLPLANQRRVQAYDEKLKKPNMVKTGLDKQIAKLVGNTDHKTLAVWACDCAERVLPYFEKNYPGDNRPRVAIEAGRAWARTGVFRMADVREAALAAHAAARDAGGEGAARSAARAAGHALATAHVPRHSIAAAVYAATAVRDGVETADADAAVTRERGWQYQRLLELR